MKKFSSGQKTAMIIVGIILLTIIILASVYDNSSENTIQVSGTATIDVTPDVVSIYFNIDTQGQTSKEASDKNNQIVNDLKTSLISLGFDESQIQTQSYNVYPNYEYGTGSQVLNGYRATHSVKIELPASEYETVGDVIDAGINSGAGIGYINFELNQENQNKYKAEAIELAAQDATLKAESVASGFNKHLGKLVSTSIDNYDYYPWAYGDFSTASSEEVREAATNIVPSDQAISARVTAIFRLK